MRISEIIQRNLEQNRPTFSVEFFPPKTPEAESELYETAELLGELGLDYVSVTYGAGGSTREGTVEITTTLKDRFDLEVMAHLSCVGETADGLRETIGKISERGIDNIFALRGDPPRGEENFVQPEGGLGSSPELLELIHSEYDFSTGGACFPEVHPEAKDFEADLDFLSRKVDAGAEFLITQLFFDNQVYFDFVAAARERGIDVPIIAGVIPVAGWEQVKRICSLCDASIPTQLEGAMNRVADDPQAQFEIGVAYAAQQATELLVRGAPGIHFYALNKAPATRAVLSAIQAAKPWERQVDPVPAA